MVALGSSHDYANLCEDLKGVGSTHFNLQSSAQHSIVSYLQERVCLAQPKHVLFEFNNLFFHPLKSSDREPFNVLITLVKKNKERDFIEILKRSCYVLFKNWAIDGKWDAVGEMLQLFVEPTLAQKSCLPLLNRVRSWVRSFAQSQDFDDFKQLVRAYSGYGDRTGKPPHWGDRYSVYQWVAQAADPSNPPEQRELASEVAQRLKDRFKYDLAMYTARAQCAGFDRQMYPNPTIFGDEALRSIELLVVRCGDGTYETVSRRLLDRMKTSNYQHFKEQFLQHLLSSGKPWEQMPILRTLLERKLNSLYPTKSNEPTNSALILVTCNRAIQWLTTENGQEPSPIFKMLISQGYPLTLAIALLKLILISPNFRIHLECCLSNLIAYYKRQVDTEPECGFAIQFFEVMKIILAIYGGDVEYSLVKIQRTNSHTDSSVGALQQYRLFLKFKSTSALQPLI